MKVIVVLCYTNSPARGGLLCRISSSFCIHPAAGPLFVPARRTHPMKDSPEIEVTLTVFILSFPHQWQRGRGNRADLIFCSFCIKAKGKDNSFFLYFSLMKSTKNPARTMLSPRPAKTAEIGAKSI